MKVLRILRVCSIWFHAIFDIILDVCEGLWRPTGPTRSPKYGLAMCMNGSFDVLLCMVRRLYYTNCFFPYYMLRIRTVCDGAAIHNWSGENEERQRQQHRQQRVKGYVCGELLRCRGNWCLLMEIVLGRVIREKLRKANGRERVRERKREMGERERIYDTRYKRKHKGMAVWIDG